MLERHCVDKDDLLSEARVVLLVDLKHPDAQTLYSQPPRRTDVAVETDAMEVKRF